jgi:hypothetical protein
VQPGVQAAAKILAFLGVMFKPSSVARVQTKVWAFIGSKQKFSVLEKGIRACLIGYSPGLKLPGYTGSWILHALKYK